MGINNGTWQLISGFYLPECPPNLPFIPSLPLVHPSQFSNPLRFSLAVTLLLALSPSLSPLPPSLPLRALGLWGSCQESRRARWCHHRRHRWGRPGQPECSAPPRGGTLRSESCHTVATAEPARKQTRTHTESKSKWKSTHTVCTGGKSAFPLSWLNLKMHPISLCSGHPGCWCFIHSRTVSWGENADSVFNPLFGLKHLRHVNWYYWI